MAALLPLEAGPDCSAVVPRGQRLVVAAVHVLGTLHHLQHVPDVHVGECGGGEGEVDGGRRRGRRAENIDTRRVM